VSTTRDNIVNVTLAALGTATQAVVQAAATPAMVASCPWLVPLGVVVGAIAGHEVNRLAARVDRGLALRNAAKELLANQHLPRVCASVIARRLQEVAAGRPDGKALAAVARRADEWWPALVAVGSGYAASVSDDQITSRIVEYVHEGASKAPTAKVWCDVLAYACSHCAQPELTPETAEVAGEVLEAYFIGDTIEGLKADFVQDGEAFARVALTFFSQILFVVQHIESSVESLVRDSGARHRELRAALETIRQESATWRLNALETEAVAHLALLPGIAADISVVRQDVGEIKAGVATLLLQQVAAPRRVPIQLPPRATAGVLVGRDTLRAALADRLRRRLDTDVVGPAGFGKTALAADAVRDAVGGETEAAVAASAYPDGVVLLDLYRLKHGDLNEAWSFLAHSFGEPERQNEAPEDRARRAAIGRRALVIVEGAEEAKNDQHESLLGRLLAVLDTGAVRLALTRDPAQATVGHRRLSVDAELSAADSIKLLVRMGVEADDARRVYQAVGGHPLALTWAGAASGDTTADWGRLLDDLSKAGLPRIHDPEYEVHTLGWLYERGLRRMSADARRALAAIGCLAFGPVPAAAVGAMFDGSAERASAAITLAARAAFVARVDGRQGEWTLTHALAHRFAREQSVTADDVARLSGWCELAIREAIAKRSLGDLSLLRQALRHAEALLTSRRSMSALHALAGVLVYNVGQAATALGSLDVSRGAVRSAAAWLESLREKSRQTPRVLRDSAVAHFVAGDLARAAGDAAEAREQYVTGLQIAERLAATDPTNAEWQRDLSISHDRLGDLARAAGDVAGARAAYTAGQQIAERLAATDPTNAGWQRDLSISHNRLGDLARASGDVGGARAAYAAGRGIRERLAAADPTNAEWQRDLSISYNKLGDLAWLAGDVAGARAAYVAGRQIAERLAATDPTNAEWQRDLSVSHNRLGDLAVAAGDVAGARAAFATALRIAERLAVTDQTNADWQRDLSVSHNKLADLARAAGDVAEARRAYVAGLQIAERLAATDPTNAEWQRDLSISYDRLGDLARAAGDVAEARRAYVAGLQIAERLAATDPTNTEWQRDLSIGHNKLGDLAGVTGDAAGARRAYVTGLQIAERLAATDRTNTEWQRDLSICYERLGDLARAAGDTAEARRAYVTGLQIAERLVATDPTNAEWQRDLSIGYERLGDLALAEESVAAARAAYAVGAEIRERLAATDPTNATWQRDLSVSHNKLGDLARAAGDLAEARAAYAAGLHILQRLTDMDSSNVGWQRDLRITQSRLRDLPPE
jgi:tetratricopeptide (TPR) repeat protein